jgi:hypothetical protein
MWVFKSQTFVILKFAKHFE